MDQKRTTRPAQSRWSAKRHGLFAFCPGRSLLSQPRNYVASWPWDRSDAAPARGRGNETLARRDSNEATRAFETTPEKRGISLGVSIPLGASLFRLIIRRPFVRRPYCSRSNDFDRVHGKTETARRSARPLFFLFRNYRELMQPCLG